MYIPEYVKKVTDIIENAGEQAFLVGGCVRDCLMDRIPVDYDIAASCPPQKTVEIFSDFKVIETGIKHGTVTVVSDGHNLEITTFRIDGAYGDNRHPESVNFTADIKEDLARRDFTVNSVAYSEKTGFIDPFGGKNDIAEGIIKCVGEPDNRFEEDGLRILRGLRFAAVLGFGVEADTARSMSKKRNLLKMQSAERVFIELKKLLSGKNSESVLIRFRDVFETLFPELSSLTDGQYAFVSKCAARAEHAETAFSALFYYSSENEVSDVLCRLKTDNGFKNAVLLQSYVGKSFEELVNGFADAENAEIGFLRLFSGKYGVFQTELLYEYIVITRQKEDAVFENFVKSGCESMLRLPSLAVNGRDLKKIGFRGEKIGEALSVMLKCVALEKLENDKAALTDFAKTLLPDKTG